LDLKIVANGEHSEIPLTGEVQPIN
jgi:hypothetical protein